MHNTYKKTERVIKILTCSIIIVVVVISTGCAHLFQEKSAKDAFRNSVVRISSTMQTPYYYSPWIWKPPIRANGEGVVVGKNLVLTLASLVKNAKLIELTMTSEPLPTQMKVIAIDYNADLALLEGKLPAEAKPIAVPATSQFTRSGALNLYWKTSTGMMIEGNAILDRVVTQYAPGSLQAVTMLKAVKSTHPNIGYGIPVFDKNNRFFGLAIKGGGEYSFNIIPCDTITKRMDLVKREKKEATAVAGFAAKPLTQAYYRKKLGLTVNSGGCLVAKVFGQGSGHKQLKKGDVLLSVCGHKLDAWGKYTDPIYGQRSYTHLFSEHYISEKFPVTIMRDKKEMKIDLKLSDIKDSEWLIPINQENKKTQYIIRGGFIFIPMTKTYLGEWGPNYVNKAPISLVGLYNEQRYNVKSPEKYEYILLSRVLSHPTNIGLQNINNMIIEKVNGKPVKSLKEFAKILDSPGNDTLKLTLFPGHVPFWLSKKVMKSADQEIMKHYGIFSLQDIE